MSASTHLIAGVPASDLDAGIDWSTQPAQAGAGRITLVVAGLDVLLENLAARRITHEPIETYSNGVRHVKVQILVATPSRSLSCPTPRSRDRTRPDPRPSTLSVV